MPDKADRVMRTAADLYGSAVAEGARQRRSAKQQLDHWAVERAVSSRHTAARQTARALYDRRRAIGDGHCATCSIASSASCITARRLARSSILSGHSQRTMIASQPKRGGFEPATLARLAPSGV